MFTQLGSVLFLIHSPYGAYACSCWTLLQSTANLYSVVQSLPADKWPGVEVQGESCQSQSALCCCINLSKGRLGYWRVVSQRNITMVCSELLAQTTCGICLFLTVSQPSRCLWRICKKNCLKHKLINWEEGMRHHHAAESHMCNDRDSSRNSGFIISYV